MTGVGCRTSGRTAPGYDGGRSPSSSVVLAVPPHDADGRLLRLLTTPTDHHPVAARDLPLGPTVVRLEVLAASHRVRLGRPAGWEATETVACHDPAATRPPADAAPGLPDRHRWSAGRWELAFASTIDHSPDAVVRARRELAALDPDRSLTARFPGHPDALTALAVEDRAGDADPGPSVAWRTWHLYPGPDAHVVVTSTTATAVIGAVHRATIHCEEQP